MALQYMSTMALLSTLLSVLTPSVLSQSTTSLNYCEVLDDVLSICDELTPGFTNLPSTQQASCLCGSTLGTLSWGPATFDELAGACAVQYATIDVTIASDASALAGFCTAYVDAGTQTDAILGATASATPTGGLASPTVTATPQGSVSNDKHMIVLSKRVHLLEVTKPLTDGSLIVPDHRHCIGDGPRALQRRHIVLPRHSHQRGHGDRVDIRADAE